MITKLTFDINDMKRSAVKALESCVEYLTQKDMQSAAIQFGIAKVWMDMLSDIGFELCWHDAHVADMLETTDRHGFEY